MSTSVILPLLYWDADGRARDDISTVKKKNGMESRGIAAKVIDQDALTQLMRKKINDGGFAQKLTPAGESSSYAYGVPGMGRTRLPGEPSPQRRTCCRHRPW
jgi:hypothetical protein